MTRHRCPPRVGTPRSPMSQRRGIRLCPRSPPSQAHLGSRAIRKSGMRSLKRTRECPHFPDAGCGRKFHGRPSNCFCTHLPTYVVVSPVLACPYGPIASLGSGSPRPLALAIDSRFGTRRADRWWFVHWVPVHDGPITGNRCPRAALAW